MALLEESTGRPGSESSVRARVVLVGATALLLICALNVAQVTAPQLLTLEMDSWMMAVLVFVIAALTTLAFLGAPVVALAFLVVLVAANLSEVMVRFHGLPSLLQLLALPLGLTAFAAAWHGGLSALRRPLVGLGAVYALVVLASTAWAESTDLADAALAEQLRGVAILFLVAVLAATRRRFALACAVLVGTSAILAFLGIVQGVSGETWGEFLGLARIKHAQIYGDVFESRVAGPFGDPNFFAQNLLLVLPLAVTLAWMARSAGTRLATVAAAASIVGGIFFTYSRGAALAVAVQALLAIPLLAATYRRKVLGAAVVLLIALLVLPTGFATRLATISELLPGEQTVTDPDSSFEKRRVVTGAAWRMFLDHPALGVGAGNYTVHFDRYAAEMDSAGREYLAPDGDQHQYPHNLYLEVASETGFAGLLAFLVLVTGAVLLLHDPALARARDAQLGAWARALSIGLAGYLVAAIFLHGQFQRPFWLVLGLVSALHAIGHATEETS